MKAYIFLLHTTMKIDLHYKDTFKFIETIDHFCQIMSVDRNVSIITKQNNNKKNQQINKKIVFSLCGLLVVLLLCLSE